MITKMALQKKHAKHTKEQIYKFTKQYIIFMYIFIG